MKTNYEPQPKLVKAVARQYGVNKACAWGLLVKHQGDVTALWHAAQNWPFSVVCLGYCGTAVRVRHVQGNLYVATVPATGKVLGYYNENTHAEAVALVQQINVAVFVKRMAKGA